MEAISKKEVAFLMFGIKEVKMITITNEMIKDKAKELDVVINSEIKINYSLIYIQILKGSKENRKIFIEWIEKNRPLKVNIKIKQTNFLKELIGVITNIGLITNVNYFLIFMQSIKGRYVSSLLLILLLIPLAMQDIAKAIEGGGKTGIKDR